MLEYIRKSYVPGLIILGPLTWEQQGEKYKMIMLSIIMLAMLMLLMLIIMSTLNNVTYFDSFGVEHIQ